MYNNEIVKVGVFGVFRRQYTLALHASDIGKESRKKEQIGNGSKEKITYLCRT